MLPAPRFIEDTSEERNTCLLFWSREVYPREKGVESDGHTASQEDRRTWGREGNRQRVNIPKAVLHTQP